MASLFAKKPTPKEVMRETKRDMNSATRGVEREILNLQGEEKKLLVEIKKTARTGNQAATKTLAKELVRLRAQVTKLQGSRAQLRGITSSTQAMHANVQVASAIQASGKAMAAVNQQMSPAEAMKIAQNFQRESAQMDMAQDVMGDSLDDALDADDLDDETDELTSQVLDELGIEAAAQLASAPKSRIAGKAASQQDADRDEEADLERRLAALR
eukprot:TRINITY_DN10395_c0_g1_i1.p1 TRINITY_DN10395_c0_g1~~TRINITY_DN10395_c0_g1_i1.p1  ORF type:complete len:214 (-),score=59.29 TRINITY_DN10395_c0_g1_i1:593-1234(-)